MSSEQDFKKLSTRSGGGYKPHQEYFFRIFQNHSFDAPPIKKHYEGKLN